ncbi:MAG: hypothetical protein R3190_02140, partial [Thermoanaerobaculia bacterium]|nr:hypothetical protein [Thermoanaerobaculia bacterium]
MASPPTAAALGTLIALAAIHGSAPPAAGQEAEPPPGAVFRETIDVRVINVEVVVTDGTGRRIAGLRPEDFRVEVDGVETPIDFFTEIQNGRATTALTAGGAAGRGGAPVPEGQPV